MDRKQLLLNEGHRRFGRFGTRYGWELPLVFSSTEAEFQAAQSSCALFDASFFGRIAAEGRDALDLFQRLSTNDLQGLGGEKGIIETVFTSEKGRILDLVTVLMTGSKTTLVTSPGREETLLQWIDRYCITEDIRLSQVTDDTAMFYLFGPHISSLISSLFSVSAGDGKTIEVSDAVQLTLWTGRHGMQALVLVARNEAAKIWESIVEKGREYGLTRMGFDAYEAYRISRGIPAPEAELSLDYNPWEVGLGSIISTTKGCYLGQEVVARLETYQKVRRKLTGLVFSSFSEEPALPMPLKKGDSDVGMLTSVTRRPVHGKYLGLGVVRTDMVSEGDSLSVQAGEALYHGVALTPPILM